MAYRRFIVKFKNEIEDSRIPKNKILMDE